MAVTITWQIDWMNTSTQTINGFTEVVLNAGWRCIGTEQSGIGDNPSIYSGNAYSSVNFTEPTSGSSFTPYDQLTQEQVLGWCWANGVNKTATEASVQASIEKQINPPIVQHPLPWTTPTA
jgi:hypothetical protein